MKNSSSNKNCAEDKHPYIVFAEITYQPMNGGNGRTKIQWCPDCNKIKTTVFINGLILNVYETGNNQ